jgi:hypothetical protein
MCKIMSFGLDGAPELRRDPAGVEVSPTGIQSHQTIRFLHISFHGLVYSCQYIQLLNPPSIGANQE